MMRLGDILAETRNGLYKPEEYYGRGTRILKMYNIGRLDGTWNLERVDLIQLSEEESIYSLSIGDLLLNRVNSRELVGKCAVVDDSVAGCVFESKNMRLRLNANKADPHFTATWLNSAGGRSQMEDRLKQIVGQATVNRSDLDSIKIPLPALAVQQRIASMLNEQKASAQRVRKAIEEELDAINKLPAALLRRAFNGEL
jgi:type I restriction enzyme S subunit